MAIKVTRNDAGNCITFIGSTNPVYWNACLEGQINADNSNNIDVINKIRTVESGETVYEFFNLPYTDFQDKDGNDFTSPSDCAQYITDNANVIGTEGTYIFSASDLLDAKRDATDTTVLFSNGDIYAVNSLHAASDTDTNTITISTVRGDKDIYQRIRYYNVSVNEGAVINFQDINAAVDRLNEVLSGGTVTSATGSLGSSITTTSATGSFTVYGDRITESGTGATLGYTSTADVSGTTTNFDTSNGIYSNQTIENQGEYFEFSQDGGDWSNARGVYVGLFDETTYDVADLDVDVAGNAVKSVLYLRLKNSPFLFADSTATTGKLTESGFTNSPNTKETFRLGIDNQGYAYISHQLPDNSFEVIGRTESPLAASTQLRFIAIMPLANELNGIRNFTVNTEVAGANLTWYYIESPDGEFHYPLFADEASAITVDELYGTAGAGAGTAHAHTYIDDTSGATWYVPDSYHFHDQTAAPTAPAGIAWNEISTAADADYAPSVYNYSFTVSELASVNIPIKPAGDGATYNVTNIPAGLTYNSVSGFLVGTAPEVTGDNVANPSDVYSITVTKSNGYGSSVGTLTLTVNNLTVPVTAITGFTLVSGSAALVDANTLDNGSAVSIDETVATTDRVKITDSYITTNVLPALQAAGDKVFIGFADPASGGWGVIGNGDFLNGFRFEYVSSNQVKVARLVNGAENSVVTHSYSTNLGYDFYLSNEAGVLEANYNISSVDKSGTPSVFNGGSFTYSSTYNTGVNSAKTIVIAAVDTQCDISTTGISEHTVPVPSGSSTDFNYAVDFSGGSEHITPVSSSWTLTPVMMNNLAVTTAAPSTSGNTSSDSNATPWATAIVFQTPNNTSNQHIWNVGEGASTGDDNIYLRMTGANGELYFGWGRTGVGYNEYHIGNFGGSYNQSTGQWWGIYVGFNGTRLSGANATAANLVNAFDIRLMGTNDVSPVFNTVYDVGSDVNDWVSTGVRMDRSIAGAFTIGGRGANRSFHGKVASMVVTTLKQNDAMPDTTEIKMMLTDPIGWINTYKAGDTFRQASHTSTNTTWNTAVGTQKAFATQVWLMGDGTNDSFTNGIRNQVFPTDGNYTKMNFNNMAVSDIQSVSISGL